jgi:hypothetical protein
MGNSLNEFLFVAIAVTGLGIICEPVAILL